MLAASPDAPRLRQPDGVYFDLPAARDVHCGFVAEGVVTLCAPLPFEDAVSVAHAYFRSFTGDDAALGPWLGHEARRYDAGSSSDLAASLERRRRTLDYTHVPVDTMVAFDGLRVFSFDAAPRELRRDTGLREGEVVVEVPLRETHLGLSRYFGPKVWIVLRREGEPAAWKVGSVVEDGPWL